ncbi:cytochrome b5 [Aspergillus taichungensis]|uniref:Cytochrome b5 n=1 Tax=Aspergillus taichungensis TaxID=482145 RepID=A0A2J5HM11_9EURO|nr:cytochrome b5 [Aspergillus taichungensis]
MSQTKELTLAEIAGHNTKKDLYMTVHDKVYDVSAFVDEHPGGEEVLLDVAGQDATEAFEDVGHSDEAREILDGMFVGNVKRLPGDPEPRSHTPAPAASSGSGTAGIGVGLYAVFLIGGVISYVVYNYLQQQQGAAQ